MRLKRKRNSESWIGVDLDGTLAEYEEGSGIEQIGAPVKPMMDRLKRWLRYGYRVKIFTARAGQPGQTKLIHDWLQSYGLPPLEVTNKKDRHMIATWDDKAVEVETNTGKCAMWLHNIDAPLAPRPSATKSVPSS